MIGGTGEKKTLRLVAEHADMCNVLGNPQMVRRLMNVLDHHCEDVGRDPSSVCRTVLSMVIVRDTPDEAEAAIPAIYQGNPSPLRPVAGTREEVVRLMRDLLEAGADGLILSCAEDDCRPEYIAMLADLAAEARTAAGRP
jgi:alkanesulfonate monooxygenase SsuD/methylene tetrahydromethanopterin reductase-like flavin-dependent oxidoreductase (luciferase family)